MSEASLPQRRRIRLSADACRASGTSWLLTIHADAAVESPFNHPHLAEQVVAALNRCAADSGVTLHLACLMPSHLHAVASIERGDLVAIVQRFKSFSTRLWWQTGENGSLWQRSFHDRGLRTDAHFEEAIRYILENPIKAGLVQQWERYPWFCGALMFDTLDDDSARSGADPL